MIARQQSVLKTNPSSLPSFHIDFFFTFNPDNFKRSTQQNSPSTNPSPQTSIPVRRPALLPEAEKGLKKKNLQTKFPCKSGSWGGAVLETPLEPVGAGRVGRVWSRVQVPAGEPPREPPACYSVTPLQASFPKLSPARQSFPTSAICEGAAHRPHALSVVDSGKCHFTDLENQMCGWAHTNLLAQPATGNYQ